jgi:membrane-associated protease RseP (regulator of RpoE activity)
MLCSSQEKKWLHKSNKAGIWAVLLPIFLVGCGSSPNRSPSREYIQRPSQPTPTPVAARNIVNNSQLHATSCASFEPSRDGRRAFFGFEIEDSTMTVTGFFYCGTKSPAKEAGLNIGDKITKIRGCNVSNATDVMNQINQSAPGNIIFVEIIKAGTTTPKPIGISTMGHLPIAENRPGRDPNNNKCTLTSK